MKAIVLAGGYATRLWPVTKDKPKMILPMGENLVIDYILEELESDSRIEDVFVSTNKRFANVFETHLNAKSYEKPTVSVEGTNAEEEKLGVVGALSQLVTREQLEGDDLLVVAGDNLMTLDLSDFIDAFEQTNTPMLATYDIQDYEEAQSYGLVDVEDGLVVDFQEKPANPETTLVAIACYAFPSGAVEFSSYLDGENNPDEPGWYMKWLQNRQNLRAHPFTGEWYDIGTPANYLEAVGWQLNGENRVADSAVVSDSTLEQNVHVLPGAEVYGSTLRNTVVFPDARVRHCRVNNSILDTNAYVRDLRLDGALIGQGTETTRD